MSDADDPHAHAAPEGYVRFDEGGSSPDLSEDVRKIGAVLAACAGLMVVGALLPLVDQEAFFGSGSMRLADGSNRGISVYLTSLALLAVLAAMAKVSLRLLAIGAGILAIPSTFGTSIVVGIGVASGLYGDETSIADARAGFYLFGVGAVVSLVVGVRLIAALRGSSSERRFGLASITCVAASLLAAAVRMKEVLDFQEDLGWLVTMTFAIALLFLPLAAAGAAAANDEGFALCAAVLAGALFLVLYTVATFDGLTLSLALRRTEDKIVIGSYALGFVVAAFAIGGPTALRSVGAAFTIDDRWDDEDDDDFEDTIGNVSGAEGLVPPTVDD